MTLKELEMTLESRRKGLAYRIWRLATFTHSPFVQNFPNSPKEAMPNTLNISLINKNTKQVLEELGKHEIYLSTTTACALGNMPSKSVLAITGDETLAANTLRISISHLTTMDEINEFLRIFRKIND